MARRMNVDEREAFLAETRVGVISVAGEHGRAPLTVPIWYDYRPGGEVTVLTSPSLRKARLIDMAQRFSLCVQDDGTGDTAYRYVTVEGQVVDTSPATETERRNQARRYLGPELAGRYLDATREAQADNVSITMSPDHWHAISFDDLAGALAGSDTGASAG